MTSAPENLRIFTIGHSTRTIEDFVKLLLTHEVTILVGVRSFPRSHTNPQFKAKGVQVLHILNGQTREHRYSSCAKVGEGELSYD